MTTTDDARLVEIEARLADTPTIPGGATISDDEVRWITATAEDVRYLLDRLKAAEDSRDGFACDLDHAEERLKAAESHIRELEEALTEARDFFESGRFIRVEGEPITALRDKIASALHSDEVQEEGNGVQ